MDQPGVGRVSEEASERLARMHARQPRAASSLSAPAWIAHERGPARGRAARGPGLALRREVTMPAQTSSQELPLGRVPGQGQSPAIGCGRLVLTF